MGRGGDTGGGGDRGLSKINDVLMIHPVAADGIHVGGGAGEKDFFTVIFIHRADLKLEANVKAIQTPINWRRGVRLWFEHGYEGRRKTS